MTYRNYIPGPYDAEILKTEGKMKVTADEVKAAMIASDIKHVHISDCSMCDYPLSYVREGEELFFDPGCDCLPRQLERRSYGALADLINMQTSDEWRNKFRVACGLSEK